MTVSLWCSCDLCRGPGQSLCLGRGRCHFLFPLGALRLWGGSAQGVRRPLSRRWPGLVLSRSLSFGPISMHRLCCGLTASPWPWPFMGASPAAGSVSSRETGAVSREQDAPVERAVRRSLRTARAPWKTARSLLPVTVGETEARGGRGFVRVA